MRWMPLGPVAGRNTVGSAVCAAMGACNPPHRATPARPSPSLPVVADYHARTHAGYTQMRCARGPVHHTRRRCNTRSRAAQTRNARGSTQHTQSIQHMRLVHHTHTDDRLLGAHVAASAMALVATGTGMPQGLARATQDTDTGSDALASVHRRCVSSVKRWRCVRGCQVPRP